jgi:hypothetical protein
MMAASYGGTREGGAAHGQARASYILPPWSKPPPMSDGIVHDKAVADLLPSEFGRRLFLF